MLKSRHERDYLSATEAAQALGVSHDTILRWRNEHGFGYRPTPVSPWRIDPRKVATLTAPRAAAS